MEEENFLNFGYGEGEDRVDRKLKKGQVNAERLAQMFGLEVTGIHVVDEFSGSTEWPNRDGRFDLSDFRRESYLKVEGRKMASSSLGGLQSPSYPSSSTTSSYSSLFRSVVPTKKKSAGYCLKVTLAKMIGNKVTDHSRQTYISINDITGTVPYIASQCQDEFNNHSLILVSGNGLPIEDNDATRGSPTGTCIGSIYCRMFQSEQLSSERLVFWKANSRKVFAIPAPVKKEVSVVQLDGDDTDSEDFETTTAAKKGIMVYNEGSDERGWSLHNIFLRVISHESLEDKLSEWKWTLTVREMFENFDKIGTAVGVN